VGFVVYTWHGVCIVEGLTGIPYHHTIRERGLKMDDVDVLGTLIRALVILAVIAFPLVGFIIYLVRG